MSPIYILIVLVHVGGYHGGGTTRVTVQEFGSQDACRAAAQEIKRQTEDWKSDIRMSCVPKGSK